MELKVRIEDLHDQTKKKGIKDHFEILTWRER